MKEFEPQAFRRYSQFTTKEDNMARFADEFVSVPIEVYDDLIRDSNTLYNVRSIIKHEVDEGYSVIGSGAAEILMAILGIAKETSDDGTDLD